MKDYTKSSWWVNKPPRNMTQTMYTRFKKFPSSELSTKYNKAIDKYNRITRDWNKTRYSELIEERGRYD